MQSAGSELPVRMPETQEEQEAVRQQMNRLLQTSHFSNSKRYPALFRFIVEETLAGRGQYLKERLLGVQVFGRPANYDTASDPIVRVTVAEIRKRIAQYYHEEAHDSEMRIELTPGSYEPEFRPRREAIVATFDASQGTAITLPMSVSNEVEVPVAEKPPGWLRYVASGRPKWMVAVGLVSVALIACLGWRWAQPTALDDLWAPVLAGHKTITFCLPTGAAKDDGSTAIAAGVLPADEADNDNSGPNAKLPSFRDYENYGENVVYSDVLATLRISNMLTARGRESRYRLTTSTELDDLRQGPDILIGGLDNQWTLRALAPLRFRFSGADRNQFWILDSTNPTKRNWGLDLKSQYATVNRDYAIIARIHDDATGQVTIIVAGIGMSGTAAAGEFLIDSAQAKELRARIGPGFRDHDFEAVLSTDVVKGVAGPPKILMTDVH